MLDHLKLWRGKDDDVQRAIIDIIKRFPFHLVSYDEQDSVLNLAYDASRHSDQGLEVILEEHHLHISHDWWTHIPDGFNWLITHCMSLKKSGLGHPWFKRQLAHRGCLSQSIATLHHTLELITSFAQSQNQWQDSLNRIQSFAIHSFLYVGWYYWIKG